MELAIIGTGYVGLVTAAHLATNHDVTCVDLDEDRIKQLNAGKTLIKEAGLSEALASNTERIRYTTDYPASPLYLVAVGTPERPDGGCDLTYVDAAIVSIFKANPKAKVVIKSTVPPGTTEQFARVYPSLTFAMVPEFLREGTALSDIERPDRLIIGTTTEAFAKEIEALLGSGAPVLVTDPATAELTKYAANSFLAVKISSINEMARLAEKVGADVKDVARGIGLDHRIGPDFLKAGAGYGGSCFPKDIAALSALAAQHDESLHVVEGAARTNAEQLDHLYRKIAPASGMHVALLGLAFKPGTDDTRDAPALRLAEHLQDAGVVVTAYDPAARTGLDQKETVGDALEDADVAVLMTDWDELKQLAPEAFSVMRTPRLIDGRNCWRFADRPDGVEYEAIGRARKLPSNNLSR